MYAANANVALDEIMLEKQFTILLYLESKKKRQEKPYWHSRTAQACSVFYKMRNILITGTISLNTKEAFIKGFVLRVALYGADLDYTKSQERQNRNFCSMLEKNANNFMDRKYKKQ